MVPWVAAARRLEDEDDSASGSGAAGSRTWESIVDTPEGKAMASGVVVLLVAVIAYVMHRDVIASCVRAGRCLDRRLVLTPRLVPLLPRNP